MENINYETFNKGFFVRMSRYEKWEKAEFDAFEAFLSYDEPLSPETKDRLPQFTFNVVEGSSKNTLHYPIEFLVTEIDLPRTIKEKVKQDEALAKHWTGQFKSWYRKIRSNEDIPFWMLYITSSGHGFRFLLQVDKPINNEAEYRAACKQFLKLLDMYGINNDFQDQSTINKGWYLPTDKRYFDVRGDVFSPDLVGIIPEPVPIKTKNNPTIDRDSLKAIENVMSQIEQKEIDITEEYNDWIHIGFALAYSLKEDGRDYFHRISLFHVGYNKDSCDKQYDACLRSTGSGITLGTLFYIAQKYGIQIPSGNRAMDDRFWIFEGPRLKIDYDAYFKLLHSKGIGRLARKYSDDVVFIKVDKSVKRVWQISKNDIAGYTTQLIEDLNVEASLKKKINNAFLGDSKILMPKNYAAIKSIQVDFMKEDTGKMYFFFQNCFVKVTRDAMTTQSYEEMDGYIWASQIIPRDYFPALIKKVLKRSEFRKFIMDVSCDIHHEVDLKRYLSLRTAIGYILHNYKDPVIPKSIVFMDTSLSKDTKGRTGKGIVKSGLSKMRKLLTEDGKQLDLRSRFTFSQVDIDTNILFIDDVPARFDFEKLFSVLTEGYTVERKHKDKFHIDYEDSPKILITTNYAISGSGDSFEGRIFEYEFSNYYSNGYSPFDKFGHRLFEGWDKEQWNLFFNFMLSCAKVYLRKGLVQAQFINLHLKKIIAKTGFAFVDYLRENIKVGVKYPKKEVYEDFIANNPTYKDWGQNKFTNHMKEYYLLQNMEVKTPHSGSDHFYMVVTNKPDLD